MKSKSTNPEPPYSMLNSDSPYEKSKGVRFSSAMIIIIITHTAGQTL